MKPSCNCKSSLVAWWWKPYRDAFRKYRAQSSRLVHSFWLGRGIYSGERCSGAAVTRLIQLARSGHGVSAWIPDVQRSAMQRCGGDKIDAGTEWAREYLTYSGQRCSGVVVTRLMQLARTEWARKYVVYVIRWVKGFKYLYIIIKHFKLLLY